MALDAGGIVGIIIAVGILIAAIVCYTSCYVVRGAEAVVVERFGRFHRVMKPGLNCIQPCCDAPRSFTWRKTYVDVNKRVRDETVTQTRVDLRENLFSFVKQEVYSRDTVLLEVSCFMLYRIVDVRKAIYEVDDLAQAVADTAQSQLKRIFGGLTFAEALASQETINGLMRTGVSQTYEKWGLHVERIELQDLRPKATSNTATAMKKQMIAERARRSEFIHAEGNKAAMRLKSEGQKIVKANLGVAEQEATRKRSEGEAAAKVELARAERTSLETIAEAVEADACSQTEFMISKRYNDLLRSVPPSLDKTVFVPYEVSALAGLVSHLPDVYGRKAASASASGSAARAAAGGGAASGSAGAASGAGRGTRATGVASSVAATATGSDAFSELN